MQKNYSNTKTESPCTHIRIRDDNDYHMNIECLIQSIEKEFNIDFRSLPRWQELIKRLHVSRTDCKRRIQFAKLQKAAIIHKLYIQSNRKSPFELNSELARTASKWKRIENEIKERNHRSLLEHDETVEEETLIEYTPHPNTEDSLIEDLLEHEPSKVDAGIQHSFDQVDLPENNLPVLIYTNPHKLISPIDTQASLLSYHSVPDRKELSYKEDIKEWYPSSKAVICNPNPINVGNDTLKQQSILFSLTNSTGQYLSIRFKYVTDESPFAKTQVFPVIPKRLYPGIPVVYKFVFILRSTEMFKTGLYFKIGKYNCADNLTEPYFIPIVSTFELNRYVKVSDTVNIPSVYPWHIKMGPDSEYPTGTVKISVHDPYSYHLNIYKRVVHITSESEIYSSELSVAENVAFENTDSTNRSHGFDNKVITVSKTNTTSKNVVEISVKGKHSTKSVNDPQNLRKNMMDASTSDNTEFIDIVSPIIEDIVQLALEAFIFESSYKFLQPFSKNTIPVHFTKAEHIGYHQCYYNLVLSDPKTEAVIMIKTVKVFAEVLAHPIQITPELLDMSQCIGVHGYYGDRFIVTNQHKLYPVTIHIKLTTKMKRIFRVIPMKSAVPADSSARFMVRFCSRDAITDNPEDLVHFTIKIIIIGCKEVYQNVPPIFYEIIAPCAVEFKKVYNEKYFKEID